MPSFPTAARPLLRPSTQPGSSLRIAFRRASPPRRFESSTPSSSSDAVAKARQTAANVTSKAAQGLSRVTSAAGPALAGAARNVTGALGRVGGRTGKLIAFVERQTPFVVYYSRVGLELSRLVFQGQKMAPPSLDVFQSYFRSAWQKLQNPAQLVQSPAALLQTVRSLTPAQLATGGVLAAECIGFFTAGEIIGRFKLVGYHGESSAAHH